MGKKSKTSDRKIETGDAPGALTSNPFASLRALGGQVDSAPAEEPAPPPREPINRPAKKAAPVARPKATVVTAESNQGHIARAVVRYERKGHGGKEATRVEKLGLSPSELEALCKELKRVLGCGGRVEGDCLLFSGDQRGRLPTTLTARGVRRVTVS